MSICVVSVVLTCANYVWIERNISPVPPPWDEAANMYMGLNDYDALRQGDVEGFIRRVIRQSRVNAPLYPLTTVPLYFMLGPRVDAAYWVNGVYMFVLLVSVYCLGEKLGGKTAGWLAVFICATYPAVITYSRDYYFEFPLACLTAACYLFLMKSDCFADRRNAVLCGLAGGLMVLTKTMGVVFLAVPVAYAALVLCRRGSPTAARRNVWLCALTTCGVSLVYYGPNLWDIVHYLVYFSFGGGARYFDKGVSSHLSLANWTMYAKDIAIDISAGYVLLFVAALIAYRLAGARDRGMASGRTMMWLWLVAGYVLLSIPFNKGERYALPILVPIGVLMAAYLVRVSGRWVRWVLIALVMVVGGINYGYHTLTTGCEYKTLSFAGVTVLQLMHVQCGAAQEAHVPVGSKWEVLPILEFMDGVFGKRDEGMHVFMAVDHHFMNSVTMKLYAKIGRIRGVLRSESTFESAAFRDLREYDIEEILGGSHFVVTKTGFQGLSHTNVYNDMVRRLLGGRQALRRFGMSDGSEVMIFAGGKSVINQTAGKGE